MKELALILSCYNKIEDSINCIESIFSSTFTNYNLIVVDNGSTNGLGEIILNKYNDKICLIKNSVNLGAGAGFNTGIRKAMQGNYKYIMTIDHDVIFEKNAIEELYNFLETNDDVAIAGSKFCYMDNPDIVQMRGNTINMERFESINTYRNCYDDEDMPDVLYVDATPAGSCMFRASLFHEIGLFDENYFIYYEDIELNYRCRKKGYKIVNYSKSKVRHKYSMINQNTTFGTYYFLRNKIHFFAMNCELDKLHSFCETILKDLFQGIYACNYYKKHNALASLMFAYTDAINGTRGEAKHGRILERDKIEDKLQKLLISSSSTLLVLSEELSNYDILLITNKFIEKYGYVLNKKLTVMTNCTEVYKQFCNYVSYPIDSVDICKFNLILKGCKHIFNEIKYEKNIIYIDVYLNSIITDSDMEYCQKYNNEYVMFYKKHYLVMVNKILGLR